MADLNQGQDLPTVLTSFGDLKDLATTHGENVRSGETSRATFDFIADYLPTEILKRGPAHPILSRLLERGALGTIHKWLARTYKRHMPPEHLEAYLAFASTAGVKPESMLRALALPDLATWAIAKKYGSRFAGAGFGCTSVIATHDSRTLHARNLDYEGAGIWDRKQLVLHYIPGPKAPREDLACVSLTSEGVHALGLTGMNEAGLSLGVHQLANSSTIFHGTPLAVVACDILRKARNIDDAISIVQEFPKRAGSWVFVTSYKGEKAAIETAGSRIHVRRSRDEFFFQTNHSAKDSALRPFETCYTIGAYLDSLEREERLSQIAATSAKRRANASASELFSLLGDLTRGESPTLAAGVTAKLDNVQSCVMDAENFKIRLATNSTNEEDEPHYRPVVDLHWLDLRRNQAPKMERPDGSVKLSDDIRARRVLRFCASSAPAATPAKKLEKLRPLAEELKISRDGWITTSLFSWLALSHGLDRDFTQASELIQATLKSWRIEELEPELHWKHRYSMLLLASAWLKDLRGFREEALREYRRVNDLAPFERVRRITRKALARPVKAKDFAHLKIDWASTDLFL